MYNRLLNSVGGCNFEQCDGIEAILSGPTEGPASEHYQVKTTKCLLHTVAENAGVQWFSKE